MSTCDLKEKCLYWRLVERVYFQGFLDKQLVEVSAPPLGWTGVEAPGLLLSSPAASWGN